MKRGFLKTRVLETRAMLRELSENGAQVSHRQLDYGDWQGKSPEEVRVRWQQLLTAWYEKPHTVYVPGGESLDDVRSRCGRALKEIVAAHQQSCVAIVAHTVVNRIILLVVMGLDNARFWHIRQDTCAINEIEVTGDAFTLVSMNDTCHLRLP